MCEISMGKINITVIGCGSIRERLFGQPVIRFRRHRGKVWFDDTFLYRKGAV